MKEYEHPGPLWEDEYHKRGTNANLMEINFLRGSVLGYESRIKEQEERIKELEEKFQLALEYQREKDARLVERNTYRVDIAIDPQMPWPVVTTESREKPIHQLIREAPLDN